MNIDRIFNLPELIEQSAFLWGPRKVGKSTLLRSQFKDSAYFDLLDAGIANALIKNPRQLGEWVEALEPAQRTLPIVIDEVQKVPQLLDEVHRLIETQKLSFILSGSSARKLRHGQANLLGGRAWRFELFPLVSNEIPNFDLKIALNSGLLPQHYFSAQPLRFLKAYLYDYLEQEIKAEAAVRNFGSFAKFLDAFSHSHGEMIVFQNIASDVGIDAKTVKGYFEILIDTLIVREVKPFFRNDTRQVITRASKYYLFDVGVASFMIGRRIKDLKGKEAGAAFEHFVLMELCAYSGYLDLDFEICYWRDKEKREVDFICNRGNVAIEVKITSQISGDDLKGLDEFLCVHNPAHAMIVCLEPMERFVTLKKSGKKINIVPWKQFLEKLWLGKYAEALDPMGTRVGMGGNDEI